MPVNIDQNGIPTLVAESDGMLDGESASILQSPEQPQVTIASVVRGFLDVAEDAALIRIDPELRRIRGSDTPTGEAALGEDTYMRITPTGGQTGRSLQWGNPAAIGSPTQALVDAMTAVSAAVRPSMTVESLVTRLIAALPEALQDKVMITVDQNTHYVYIHEFPTAAERVTGSDAVWNAALQAEPARVVKITLSEPEAEGSAASLVFEGGSTS